MTVVVAADPVTAAPPPKKIISHSSSTFTCTSLEHELVGGGTLFVFRKVTPLTPLEGELSRTHVEGRDRFVADNGNVRTYRIDYFRIVLDYGDFYYETMWEGRFIVDDLSTENYWYADPGEAWFSAGGYVFAGPPWRSVCEELGYDTTWGV